jgi:phosphoribulokinase
VFGIPYARLFIEGKKEKEMTGDHRYERYNIGDGIRQTRNYGKPLVYFAKDNTLEEMLNECCAQAKAQLDGS